MDDNLLLRPRAVLQRVSEGLPLSVRKRVIVVGSLAAGFHFFGEHPGMEVRTKDADCLLPPRLEATLQNWEQGRRRPRGAAVALIRIVASDPRVLRRILSTSASE